MSVFSKNTTLYHTFVYLQNRDAPGAIRLQMQNSLAALADFESAIRLDSAFAKAYFNRGVTRYKLREIQGAFEDFQKAAGLFKQQGRMDSYQDAVSQITKLWC